LKIFKALKLQYDQLVSFSNCTTLNEFGSINETSWNEMSAGLQTIPNKSAISGTPESNIILQRLCPKFDPRTNINSQNKNKFMENLFIIFL